MKNADMPATAQSFAMTEGECGTAMDFLSDEERYIGFTKREQVLKDFMAGMLSNPNMDYGYPDGASGLAADAMRYTDAYFEELSK